MDSVFKYKIHLFSLFFLGFLSGLALMVHRTANYGIISGFKTVGDLQLGDLLKPVCLSPPQNICVYRPVSALFFHIYYKQLGINLKPLGILMAILLGLWGIILYNFYLRLNRGEKIVAYFSSLFSIFSIPVLITIVTTIDSEFFGVFFSFLALLIFTKLENGLAKSKKMGFFLAFMLTSVIAILSKETSRVFFPLAILAYCLYAWKCKKLNRLQLATIPFLLMITTYSTIATLIPSFKRQITLSRALFTISHTMVQLIYPFFGLAIIIIILPSFEKLLSSKYEILISILLILLIIVVVMPIFRVGEIHHLVFFSSEVNWLINIFSILFVFALAIRIIEEQKEILYHLICILGILGLSILTPLAIPTIRADISVKTFTMAVPFWNYLLVDSFFYIWKIRDQKSKLNRYVFSVVLVAGIVAVLYTRIALTFNLISEKNAFIATEYESKKLLTNLNLTNSTVFYTNSVAPTLALEMEVLGAKKLTNTTFEFLEASIPFGSEEELIRRICKRSHGKVYFHLLTPRIDLKNAGSIEAIKGNFRWTEKNSLPWLETSPEKNSYGPLQLIEENIYTNKTLLEKILEEKNATLLYSDSKTYYQILVWLENFFSRSRERIPFIIPYKFLPKIYYLERKILDCQGL